jgi:hypothetical protein
MYAKQDARLYAHVPVWCWPWLWWQLWHLKAWILETGLDVAVAVDQRGNLRVTYVSDDPHAPKRWKAEHMREYVRPFADMLKDHERPVMPAEAGGFGRQLLSCAALSAVGARFAKQVPYRPFGPHMNQAQGWDPPRSFPRFRTGLSPQPG